jgi:hypothetical protein
MAQIKITLSIMTPSLFTDIKLEASESLICDFISILTCFITEKIKNEDNA